MKKDPISFKVKGKEYYWDNHILKIKDGEDWKVFTGIIEYSDSKQWYENGLRHRIDGPADIRSGEEIWYYEGKRHRTSGPAIIRGNSKEYWLFGQKYREEDWKIMARKIKLEKLLA